MLSNFSSVKLAMLLFTITSASTFAEQPTFGTMIQSNDLAVAETGKYSEISEINQKHPMLHTEALGGITNLPVNESENQLSSNWLATPNSNNEAAPSLIELAKENSASGKIATPNKLTMSDTLAKSNIILDWKAPVSLNNSEIEDVAELANKPQKMANDLAKASITANDTASQCPPVLYNGDRPATTSPNTCSVKVCTNCECPCPY